MGGPTGLGQALERAGEVTLRDLSTLCSSRRLQGHLAIMAQPYLDRVLSGEKRIESRLSRTKHPPFGMIQRGHVVFLKEVSGPIRGIAWVEQVLSLGPLDPGQLLAQLEPHSKGLCWEPEWIVRKGESRFATLLFLGKVDPIAAVPLEKRDRRGWVVFSGEVGDQRALF
jgi:hypothetical protein